MNEKIVPVIIKKAYADLVSVNGHIMSRSFDSRGRRDKFWLDEEFLYKSCLNDTSLENEGEVFISLFAKKAGLKTVTYVLANYMSENGEQRGVVSKNYRKMYNGDIEEISGKTLMDLYADHIYDNEKGKVLPLQNTVKFYCRALKMIFPNCDAEKIKNDLLKMALFDYMVNQRDRHIFNVTFIKEGDEISLAPLYDNGAAFMLNYGEKKMDNLAEQLKRSKNVSNYFMQTVGMNPMLGIKSVTSDIELLRDDDTGSLFNAFSNDKERVVTFEEELAEEIKNNPELSKTYETLKNIDIKEMFDQAETYSCNFSEGQKYFMSEFYDYKIKRIDKVLNKKNHAVKASAASSNVGGMNDNSIEL